MKKLGGAVLIAAVVLLAGCAGEPAPAPTVTVTTTVTATPAPAPTVTVTVAPPAAAPQQPQTETDLTTDAGLCAADAEMTNLELNDAIAPTLGYPADGDLRTPDQDAAIRDYKNAAFLRACPARAA